MKKFLIALISRAKFIFVLLGVPFTLFCMHESKYKIDNNNDIKFNFEILTMDSQAERGLKQSWLTFDDARKKLQEFTESVERQFNVPICLSLSDPFLDRNFAVDRKEDFEKQMIQYVNLLKYEFIPFIEKNQSLAKIYPKTKILDLPETYFILRQKSEFSKMAAFAKALHYARETIVASPEAIAHAQQPPATEPKGLSIEKLTIGIGLTTGITYLAGRYFNWWKKGDEPSLEQEKIEITEPDPLF